MNTLYMTNQLPPQFVEEMKQSLLAAKAKLQADLAGLQPHTELGNAMDENAEEVAIDEVNQDLISRMTIDLAKIEKALQKIETGNYGTDDNGKLISEERLRVIPWADKAI